MKNFRISRATGYSALFLFVLFSAACTYHIRFTKSSDVDEQEDPNSILVFGYVDDSNAPFTMKWGTIKQIRPLTDEPFHEFRSDREGLFYLENLPVGSYRLEDLGGPEKGITTNHPWRWSFPTPSQRPEFKHVEFTAKKPGIYFVGTYKIYLVREGGLFTADEHRVDVTSKPSEKELLNQLLAHTEGTKWHSVVKRRLKALK